MPVLQIMAYYKRHLPHWQPAGARYFITFRLGGSLPHKVIQELQLLREQFNNEEKTDTISEQQKLQRKVFQKYENLLDKADSGPLWLRKKGVASIVENSLHFYNDKKYDLYAYCIMPNHVHIVFKHLDLGTKNDKYPITTLLQSIKSYSALECNKILKRTGSFWQSESFDRVIRGQDELENTIRYTLENPVKAGLVQQWEDWSYNYCKPEFIDAFKTK